MKLKAVYLIVAILFSHFAMSQIEVSKNGRYLQTKDGKPFFWLGDTDWEIFHRLTREQAEIVIDTRKSQGFNVLQCVALAEFNGIREPNRYGDYPLNNEDPTQLLITPGNNPNNAYEYDYWDHVDFVISKAAEKNMYIGLLPTWGDKVTPNWGDGPVIFNEQNARQYGAILAKRYANHWNVIWILGGDRPAVYSKQGKDIDDRPIWRAMAAGIQEVSGTNAFITYHPSGGETRTSSYIHDEVWMNMNALQSGHGSRESQPWKWITEDLAKVPQKPIMDMEPCYEDHPVNPWDGKWTRRQRGYFNAYDVRARIYRGLFAGSCGVTYGHHQVWQFLDTSRYAPIYNGDTLIGWEKALKSEAATEIQYLKNLMLSRPYFSRIADQNIIKSPLGDTYVDVAMATRDEAGTYAMIYVPQQRTIKIDLSKVTGKTKNIWWFDVRTGKAKALKAISGSSSHSFTPPGEGMDWVLVIDDASKKYGPPGSLSSN